MTDNEEQVPTCDAPFSLFDSREFRNVLGHFPTGVTVITARGRDGRYVGLTANSFSSVSLDPPLVLWSLAKRSNSAPDFLCANHFVIHVLTREQRWLAERFASRVEERFEGLTVRTGAGCAPLLDGCAARIECRVTQIVDGGDHHILLGQPIALQQADDHPEPLVFHRGGFTALQTVSMA